MKTHRFLVEGELSTGAFTIENKELYNQIRNVLKLAVGEPVILFNGTGAEAVGFLAGIEKSGITIEISRVQKNVAEPKRFVRLYLAILKNEHFELAVQHAVECGVSQVIPVLTSRTIKLSLKTDRVKKIMREAAEQSGRGVVPELADVLPFSEAIAQAKENDVNLFCSGGSSDALTPVGTKIGVWVGPEGGFTAEEVELARASGFKLVSLGELTLRAETAAIVATYLAAH